jgi:arginine repressor
MVDAPTSAAERRREVRDLIATGEVTSLRDLAGRLQDQGIATTPDALRSDVRSLGAIRVQRGDGTVLALPVDDRAPTPAGASRLTAEIAADPDWRIQVGVVAVVAAFLLVALIGWLISV